MRYRRRRGRRPVRNQTQNRLSLPADTPNYPEQEPEARQAPTLRTPIRPIREQSRLVRGSAVAVGGELSC